VNVVFFFFNTPPVNIVDMDSLKKKKAKNCFSPYTIYLNL